MINFSFVYRIDTKEDLADSEYEDDGDADVKQLNDPNEVEKTESTTRISWLLQVALENLGVTVTSYIVSLNLCLKSKSMKFEDFFFHIQKPNQSAASVQVRHQCLQIILMMAPHYIWIKPHLLLIAQALESKIQDDVATVRHRAARCLDIVAHSISTHLLSQSNVKSNEFEVDIEMALEFWSKMLNIITQQLQDMEQNAATKSIFCDAYSNIGVHVYERLSVRL